MVIKINLDPSLELRMTNWKCLVILRTEGTKNLGFALLPLVKGAGGIWPAEFAEQILSRQDNGISRMNRFQKTPLSHGERIKELCRQEET